MAVMTAPKSIGEPLAGEPVAANKHDLRKVLRRLLDMGCKEGTHIPSAELWSLDEWLKSWGDGPNWYDSSGRCVPLARTHYDRLVAAYGEW